MNIIVKSKNFSGFAQKQASTSKIQCLKLKYYTHLNSKLPEFHQDVNVSFA